MVRELDFPNLSPRKLKKPENLREGTVLTTEVVVINRDAVALAADSAASSVTGIHKFANKLFGLVHDWPIALMVYNSASFMGMPWEVLIHGYRERVAGNEQFRTLEDCAQDFIEYLREVGRTPPVTALQAHYFTTLSTRFYNRIRVRFDSAIRLRFAMKEHPSTQDVSKILAQYIEEGIAEIDSLANAEGIPITHPERILVEAKPALSDALDIVFELLPLTDQQREDLLLGAAKIFIKDLSEHPLREYTGLVLAGFGADDVFPCCRAYQIEGMVFDSLRYRDAAHQSYTYTPDNGPRIIPYAQADVVISFLFGVHEGYEQELWEGIDVLFNDDLTEQVTDLSEEQQKQIDGWRTEQIKKLRKKMMQYQRNVYIDPFMKAIRFAHRKELGELARALVDITSLRRRFSADANSVDGPIDVAVISKKDGLIWLNRKQYFDEALNPHFFTRYEK